MKAAKNPPSNAKQKAWAENERHNNYYRQMNRRYIGMKFGMLTVIDVCEKINELRCRCKCGRRVNVKVAQLLAGRKKTCGSRKCINKSRTVDHRGQVHGYLTILKRLPDKSNDHHTVWLCRCVCGKQLPVEWTKLNRGYVKSCGCKSNPSLRSRYGFVINGPIGKSNSPIARAWYITCRKQPNVCDEWYADFPVFEQWAKQNGYDETCDQYHKIYLRKYVWDKGFNPSNCYLHFILKDGTEYDSFEIKNDTTQTNESTRDS